jgi:hypothetical protein
MVGDREWFGEARRRHVLRLRVQRLRDDLFRPADVRPVGRERFVGAASEHEATRPGEVVDHPLTGDVVEVGKMPAAVLETAARVLVGGAGRLHDSIEAHPLIAASSPSRSCSP